MKFFISAAISALLLSSAAIAQTTPATPAVPANSAALPTQCGALSPTPTLPTGGHVSASAMTAAQRTYDPWAHATDESLRCRAAEIAAATAQVQAAQAAYNVEAAQFKATNDGWAAQVTAYNARGNNSQVDDHHGGMVSSHE